MTIIRLWVPTLLTILSFVTCTSLKTLRLSSSCSDDVITQAKGTYIEDSSAPGSKKYRMNSASKSRYLYRTKLGMWSITSSEANIEKSKGTIVSLSSADSPVGLSFKYYSSGSWKNDESLEVTFEENVMTEAAAATSTYPHSSRESTDMRQASSNIDSSQVAQTQSILEDYERKQSLFAAKFRKAADEKASISRDADEQTKLLASAILSKTISKAEVEAGAQAFAKNFSDTRNSAKHSETTVDKPAVEKKGKVKSSANIGVKAKSKYSWQFYLFSLILAIGGCYLIYLFQHVTEIISRQHADTESAKILLDAPAGSLLKKEIIRRSEEELAASIEAQKSLQTEVAELKAALDKSPVKALADNTMQASPVDKQRPRQMGTNTTPNGRMVDDSPESSPSKKGKLQRSEQELEVFIEAHKVLEAELNELRAAFDSTKAAEEASTERVTAVTKLMDSLKSELGSVKARAEIDLSNSNAKLQDMEVSLQETRQALKSANSTKKKLSLSLEQMKSEIDLLLQEKSNQPSQEQLTTEIKGLIEELKAVKSQLEAANLEIIALNDSISTQRTSFSDALAAAYEAGEHTARTSAEAAQAELIAYERSCVLKEMGVLKEGYTQALQQIASLTEALEGKRDDVDATKEGSTAALLTALSRLESVVECLTNEKEAAHAEVDEFKAKYAETFKQMTSLAVALESKQSELDAAIAEAEKAVAANDSQTCQLLAAVECAKAEKETALKELESFKSMYSEALRQLSSLTASLEAKQIEVEAVKSELGDATSLQAAEISRLLAVVESLTKEREQRLAEVESFTLLYSESLRQLASLTVAMEAKQTELSTAMADAEAVIASKTEELERLEAVVHSLTAEKEQAHVAAESFQLIHSETCRQMSSLTCSLEAKQHQVDAAIEELERIRSSKLSDHDEVSKLTLLVEQLESDRDIAKAQNESFTIKYEEVVSQLASLNHALEVKQNEVDAAIALTRNAAAEKEEEISHLETTVKSVAAEKESTLSEFEALKAKYLETCRQVAILSGTIESKQHEVDRAISDAAKAETQHEVELTRLEAVVQSITGVNSSVQTEVESFKSKYFESLHRLDSLTHELRTKQNELDSANAEAKEAAALLDEINRLEAALESQINENKANRSNIKALEAERTTTFSQVATLTERREKLESSISSLRSDSKKIEVEAIKWREAFEDAQKGLRENQDQLARARQEIFSRGAELEALKKELGYVRPELARAKAESAALGKLVDENKAAFDKQLISAEQKIASIERSLISQKSEFSKSQIAQREAAYQEGREDALKGVEAMRKAEYAFRENELSAAYHQGRDEYARSIQTAHISGSIINETTKNASRNASFFASQAKMLANEKAEALRKVEFLESAFSESMHQRSELVRQVEDLRAESNDLKWALQAREREVEMAKTQGRISSLRADYHIGGETEALEMVRKELEKVEAEKTVALRQVASLTDRLKVAIVSQSGGSENALEVLRAEVTSLEIGAEMLAKEKEVALSKVDALEQELAEATRQKEYWMAESDFYRNSSPHASPSKQHGSFANSPVKSPNGTVSPRLHASEYNERVKRSSQDSATQGLHEQVRLLDRFASEAETSARDSDFEEVVSPPRRRSRPVLPFGRGTHEK